MVRLRQTLKGLATKRAFYEEQIDYYNQYVKTCLDNLSSKSKYVVLVFSKPMSEDFHTLVFLSFDYSPIFC